MDDVFCSQAENIDRKFILMHTAYLIASAGESDELYSVAHKYFLQMNNAISNINVSNSITNTIDLCYNNIISSLYRGHQMN